MIMKDFIYREDVDRYVWSKITKEEVTGVKKQGGSKELIEL